MKPKHLRLPLSFLLIADAFQCAESLLPLARPRLKVEFLFAALTAHLDARSKRRVWCSRCLLFVYRVKHLAAQRLVVSRLHLTAGKQLSA